ncbi:hypothetical protein M501DRAFT_1011230 [Patellaria atrata CBS 101060]|uniref:BTB domain-containing protein n=1 Tax=Patellaria atrata CBS 101060 TaxID=1346257 RepID=A0A9P4VTA6_9PEZI|nr:hypothetical protein M501DRAFT_1011230 [Patellaria atrata CBS 101060]
MFSSGHKARHHNESFSKYRAGKSSSKRKATGSFRDGSTSRREEKVEKQSLSKAHQSPTLTSAIVTLCVGTEQRLFAAHEDVLCHSPYFLAACRGQFFESASKRIDLPDEQPEIFSSILEYLYKGDYYPKLEYDKRRSTWVLEDANNGGAESVVYIDGVGVPILKDTIIYCTAERYGLDELKKLALRKQGLQSGVQCSTILTSARYAYANTPDNDAKLRSHYLALIIRSRHTFKRSGTMQNEMEAGGKLFFDLFVAMVNHMDDIASTRSPR